MEKIPTLFKRDPEDPRRVLPEVVPGCEWVVHGEGQATRKYDGTCVMFDGARWWARREVRPGKQTPANFQPISTDENTGKTVGWELIDQSPFAKFHAEVLARKGMDYTFSAGTYELCGPKIQKNPEGFTVHALVYHGSAEILLDVPRDFEGLRDYLLDCDWEGVVWHHLNGRMAKLKKRDFSRDRISA